MRFQDFKDIKDVHQSIVMMREIITNFILFSVFVDV